MCVVLRVVLRLVILRADVARAPKMRTDGRELCRT